MNASKECNFIDVHVGHPLPPHGGWRMKFGYAGESEGESYFLALRGAFDYALQNRESNPDYVIKMSNRRMVIFDISFMPP